MWWDGFKKKNWNSQTCLVGTLRGFFLKTGTDNKLDERHTMWESIKKFHVHIQWEVVMWGFFSIGFYKQWQCYFVVCRTPVSHQGFLKTATPPICALHVNLHGVWHKYMCLSVLGHVYGRHVCSVNVINNVLYQWWQSRAAHSLIPPSTNQGIPVTVNLWKHLP